VKHSNEDWSSINIETTTRNNIYKWLQWELQLEKIENEIKKKNEKEEENKEIAKDALTLISYSMKKEMTCDWKWLLYLDGPLPSNSMTPSDSIHSTTTITWCQNWLLSIFSKGKVNSTKMNPKKKNFLEANEVDDIDGDSEMKDSIKEQAIQIQRLSFYRAHVDTSATNSSTSTSTPPTGTPSTAATGTPSTPNETDNEFLPDFIDEEEQDNSQKEYTQPIVRISCHAIVDRSLQHQPSPPPAASSSSSSSSTTHATSTMDMITKGTHGLVLFRALGHKNVYSSSFLQLIESIPIDASIPIIVIALLPSYDSTLPPVSMHTYSSTNNLSISPNLLPFDKQTMQQQQRFHNITEYRLNGISKKESPRKIVGKYSKRRERASRIWKAL
jgi:hypothetical protein